jgi:hypothetical protein
VSSSSDVLHHMLNTVAVLCWCVLVLQLLNRYDVWWVKRRNTREDRVKRVVRPGRLPFIRRPGGASKRLQSRRRKKCC